MLRGVHTGVVTIVLTQANDKDVMLITSRSVVRTTPTHGALKLGHYTVHCESVCSMWSSDGKSLCTIICMVINR